MDQVRFTAMQDGTKEEYELLWALEKEYTAALADRVLTAMAGLQHSFGGLQVSRLEHSLQSATRATADGRDDEFVVCCLLHDIGDELAPFSHSELAAAVVRPFVSGELYWVVKHHGLFQSYYYAQHAGGDRFQRDRFADHPHYAACVEFCASYDQNCFDPDYATKPLGYFEPVLRRVLAEPRFQETDAEALRS
jgi:predicted HD phosphohydrolase